MTRSARPSPGGSVSGDLLESWKEIATYLRRGVRTVRRWEKEEGLPVHRHTHRTLGSVYAYKMELDAWRLGRRVASPHTGDALLRKSQNTSRRLMIAVLPFDNLSGSVEHEYIADGLTEELIGQLGRFHQDTLGVIARTTMMQYRTTRRTVRQIGVDLDVDYVIEGSVRCDATRLRVIAQLIRVSDQTPLWSGAYEEPIRGMLSLQRELGSAINREIRLMLPAHESSMAATTDTINPEAYLAHLKGRHLLHRFTPESVRKSVTWFRRAIELDPFYAAPHASLAEAYERLPVWLDEAPASTLPLALEAAAQALKLDPNLPEAYASLGVISANYLWDWAKAERHFQRALELNFSCSPARVWYAEFLAEMGRTGEALETIDRARAHDPLSSSVQSTRAFVFMMAGRFDEAIAQAEQVLEMDPQYPMALIRLGASYAGQGRHAEAVDVFRVAVQVAPELLAGTSLLGYALGRAGITREARRHLASLRQLSKRRYVPAFLFANVHAGLGEDDEAIACLEQEYVARGWFLLLLKGAPQFERLRSHAGYQALLQRMNFDG